MKSTQDRQNIYANQNKFLKEFQVGEQVYLHIKLKKSSLWIGSCENMAPQFCGPFNIPERIGPIAYRLALPPTMKVHYFFHISFLKKYVKYFDHVIEWSVLQVDPYG